MRVVCAIGAESTGKTSLCQALAERFNVPWLGEYAREYLGGQASAAGGAAGVEQTPERAAAVHAYEQRDVAKIAREQARREGELLADTDGGVVLDTDLAVIVIWWREKYGPVPAWLEYAFAAQAPRLYLLCRPDLPWQPDPLRESPGDLQRLHEQYLRLLTERRLPFVEIGGTGEARTQAAIAAAQRCLAAKDPSQRCTSTPLAV